MENKQDNIIYVNTQSKPRGVINEFISTVSRRFTTALFGVSKNGKRDIKEIYGYKDYLAYEDYKAMYKRGGLAARIVNGFARSSWRDGFKVKKNDKEVLEKELMTLNRHGKLIKKLERADILNRIGRFSVLYVGVPDGLDSDKPIGTVRGDRLDEVYFRVYSEENIQVRSWVTEPTDPRFGLPEVYSITHGSSRDEDSLSVITTTTHVHWTRIVHLAEGALDDELMGQPCLEAVFNTLEDVTKTAGGSAEAYFRNARNRFSMETDPKFNGSLTAEEKKDLEEEAQRFQNEWQDFIRSGGINIKPLNVPHHDPINTFKVQLQILAGTTGYPIRILTGEGAGQLAGNEDKESYNQIVQDRRELVCADWVMEVLTILANAKMLTLDDEYEISWDSPAVVSSKDKATIAQSNATALSSMATALSSIALDERISLEDGIKLVFGEEALLNIKITEEVDDGLSDDEVKELDLETQEDLDEDELPPEEGEESEVPGEE